MKAIRPSYEVAGGCYLNVVKEERWLDLSKTEQALDRT